jgi:hypothetical protein
MIAGITDIAVAIFFASPEIRAHNYRLMAHPAANSAIQLARVLHAGVLQLVAQTADLRCGELVIIS